MDTRKKILDKTLTLFYEKGYDAVSVQEIVEAAGITKPTLYYYFGSKYGLLESLLEEEFSVLKELIEPAMFNEDEKFENRLYIIAKSFLTFAVDHTEFYHLFVSLMYSARENEPYKAVKPYVIEMYQIFSDMFARAEDCFTNLNDRQEQFALGFVGVLNFYFYSIAERHYREKGNAVTLADVTDAQVQALVQQFMYGIMA